MGDRAEADDADPSPADLDRTTGDHVHLRPPTGAQLALHPGEVAGDAEQRAEHPLGDGHRVEPGGVGQRHAGGVERGDVVPGHADAGLLDEGQAGRGGDVLGRQPGGAGPPVVDQQLGVGQRGADGRPVVAVGSDDGEREVAERVAGHRRRQGSERHQVPRRSGHAGDVARTQAPESGPEPAGTAIRPAPPDTE